MHHDYDVRSCTVSELLVGEGPAFVVPEFQRAYSWTSDEVEALLEDVLDDTERGSSTRYFLGAVVFVRRENALLVIDGQQRLATLSMILAVLRELMEQSQLEEDADILAAALTTKQLGHEKRPRLELQREDALSYRAVLRAASSIDEAKPGLDRVQRAAVAIRKDLLARVSRHGPDTREALNTIARHFFTGIEIVRIEARDEGSAYRLFEALNDRGRALTASDLIKNKLFARAKGHLDSVRESWTLLSRRVAIDELLSSLRHFWIAFRNPVRRNELFTAYDHEIANAKPDEIARLAAELAAASSLYRDLASPHRMERTSPFFEVKERLQRLERLRAKSCRPLLLLFGTRWPGALPQVAQMCETASIRHTLVCQRSPSPLEKVYGTICRDLRLAGGLSAPDAILIAEQGLSRWIPTDEDFVESLESASVRSNLSSWRVFLESVEDALSPGRELDVAGPRRVHIEHVLPQKPSSACLAEAGLSAVEAAELAARLGNLTLIAGAKNISMSNSPFSTKRAEFGRSRVAMNTWIAGQARWGRQEIEARQRIVAALGRTAWPWPLRAPSAKGSGAKTTSASRSTSRHEPPQLALPSASPKTRGAGDLDPSLTYQGTVWIPRILWALESAASHGLGALRSSEIARLLEQELEITIQGTNTARAFRELRSHRVAPTWWDEQDGRYVITSAGRRTLEAILSGRRPRRGAVKPSLASTRPLRVPEEKANAPERQLDQVRTPRRR